MNNPNVTGRMGLLRKAMAATGILALGVFGFASNVFAGQQTFNAGGTYTTPAGVNQITVDAWGGGGAGGYSATKTTGATGGGGGGAYARSVLAVSPSTGYAVTIGAGGTANTTGAPVNGGSTNFGAGMVIAVGGTSVAVDVVNGGAGGTAGASTGTVKYSGAVGVTGVDNPNGYGGGGGSSAGTAANGNTGVTNTGGTAPAGGGNGGTGATAAGGSGAAGSQPGGGGGGSLRTGGAQVGGPGAAGRIIVNWGPTVTINQGGSQADPTNSLPITFDVVFSEDVVGFAIGDVVLTGTATGKSVTNVSGSGTNWTVTVTATGGGTIIANIPANAAQDITSGANNSFASTSTDNQVTYTTAAKPTVTINQAGGQLDPTNGAILYTVVFNGGAEGVTDFTSTDVVLTGTAVASVTSVTGGPATYTVTVTGTDSGTVIADIPADAAIGTGTRLGLLSMASTSTDNTVTFDNLKPSVTINQGGAQADPALGGSVTFDVVFSEDVTGFVASDVIISGTATGIGKSISGSGASYTVTVTATGNGTIIATIPADAATDTAGNTSNASSSTDNEVDFQGGACIDPSPSTISITLAQTVSGLAVDLTTLYTATNLSGFTYTIDGSGVGSPWDSSAYGTTGPEVLSFTVSATDPDCGGVLKSDTQDITVDNSSLNFLLHNALTTASTKWGGNWGTAGGKYGEFVCATCHTRTTTNIKRVKTSVTAPNSPTDNFPGNAVVVTSAGAGAADFGNDSGGHATSNRVCEVCHSQNKFHNYNTANNTGGLTHANQSDCAGCHTHKQGFKSPGCNSCHGDPPISGASMVFTPSATGALANPAVAPGAHSKHAVDKGMDCNTCHKGNTMPDVSMTIQMGFEASNANIAGFTGTVTGGTLAAPEDTRLTNGFTFVSSDGSTTVSKVANDNVVCSNLYCHGNWAGNAGTINAPSWVGASQAVCGTCHGASGANPPTTGSHVAHAASAGNVKLACNKCHPSYADTAHLNGNVAWQLATADTRIGASAIYRTAASGSTGAKAPSVTYGTCSSIYCHGAATPTWGGPNIDCTGCHSSSSSLAGSHNKHYASATAATANTTTNSSTSTAYIFQCGTCHVAASTSHAGGVVGTNQSAEVSLSGGGTYTAGGALAGTDGVFKYTAGTCGFNACHNNGKATPGAPNVTAQWTVALPVNCTGCHNNNAASGTPMISNAHGVHVSDATVMSIKPCQMCHDATVDANDQAVTEKSVHVNGVRDIAMIPSYDSDANPANNWNGTNCTNVYCHSNGQPVATRTYQSITWVTTIGCTGCHAGAGVTTTLSGAHLVHVGTDATDANKQFVYTCNACHAQTALNNNTISTIANHINTTRDVAVAGSVGGTGLNDDDYVGYVLPDTDPRYGIQPIYTCATTNCHGNGSVAWNGSGTTGDCSLCHGMSKLGEVAPTITVRDTNGDTSDGDFQVGAHAVHLNGLSNYSAPMTCDQCHKTTVDEINTQTTYVAKVKAIGHIDSSQPAEISYGPIASADGAVIDYVPATRTCTNYCHGNTMPNAFAPNPYWEQNAYLDGTFTATGDCNRCHGCPPLITGHTGSETLSQCGSCHNQTMLLGNGTSFLDKTKHVNGVVEVSTSCVSCHGQLPPNTGSHPKHGIHLVQDLLFSNGNPDGVLADWTAANYPACAVCHDMTNQAFHTPAGDPTVMGVNKPDEAFAPNYPVAGPGYPVYDKPTQTCTNARCHFKPTPDWNP